MMNRLANFVRRVIRKLDKTVSSWFFIDQWVILTTSGLGMDSIEWSTFSPLIPPPDRYWADPFIVTRDGLHYVFIEEKIYKTGLGRIACLTLDTDGNIVSNIVALERPYHLSYPFLFEYENQLYMLPESAQNRSLELYRCTRFPDQWEFSHTLMQDIYAVDATLLEHGGKWWLFMNVKESEEGSSLDQLFLYYADSPLATDWTSHPINPVVPDIRTARPAGRIFFQKGNLIRPSQDNFARYGHALNFNRITKLSESEYDEVLETRFAPPVRHKIRATHTFNQSGNLTCIDAVIRRKRPDRF
jgi:hypothetical protein